MTASLATLLAVVVSLVAAQSVLRRRAVFVLGRHGHEIAPAVLASIWLCALLVGQLTGTVLGMTVVAALVLSVVALLSRRRFAPLRARHPIWTRLDWLIFAFIALVFWLVDLWDMNVHHEIVAQVLHGNLPPRAINDPRFPLAYHSLYDALVAIVVRAVPLDLSLGTAVASIFCVALTLANLRNVSRLFFRSRVLAQLARTLFVLGFGPIFIRYFLEGRKVEAFHGQTAQAYIDIILRRPAGLGFALFTLALALILPCYRSGASSESSRRRAVARLVFFLPTCALLPQAAEETVLYLSVLLLPLIVSRRLTLGMVVALVMAGLIGLSQSGVALGLLGHGSMVAPKMGLVWPPTLPSWRFTQDGVLLTSREGLLFLLLELGPIFFAALALALASGDGRQRALVAAFVGGWSVAVLVKPVSWQKSDLDRFLFYGTPPIFMLSAALVPRLARLLRAPLKATALAFGVIVCAAGLVYPGWEAGKRLRDSYQQHALGGDLARNLRAAGPREPILTTSSRADELAAAGFSVIAPFDTNPITRVTLGHYDDYVRRNADRAVWLFLPQDDARVRGRAIQGRDGRYVLVRATGGGHP